MAQGVGFAAGARPSRVEEDAHHLGAEAVSRDAGDEGETTTAAPGSDGSANSAGGMSNEDIAKYNEDVHTLWEKDKKIRTDFHNDFQKGENQRIAPVGGHYDVPELHLPPEPKKLDTLPPTTTTTTTSTVTTTTTTTVAPATAPASTSAAAAGSTSGNGLANPENVQNFESSDDGGGDTPVIDGAIEDTIDTDTGLKKEDDDPEENSLKAGYFSGKHFSVNMRWKAPVDLDLRMVVVGQNLWRADKVMHVNWETGCEGVFCIEADDRGNGPDGYRTERIYMRDDWRTLWGHTTPPDGKYSIWVQYFSAEPGSRNPVAPSSSNMEVPFEAALHIGEEFGQPNKVGVRTGKVRWDGADPDRRTKMLFTFELSGDQVSGISSQDAPNHGEAKNGWIF